MILSPNHFIFIIDTFVGIMYKENASNLIDGIEYNKLKLFTHIEYDYDL